MRETNNELSVSIVQILLFLDRGHSFGFKQYIETKCLPFFLLFHTLVIIIPMKVVLCDIHSLYSDLRITTIQHYVLTILAYNRHLLLLLILLFL